MLKLFGGKSEINNGELVTEIILRTKKVERIEKFYRLHTGSPDRTQEERVFAAYWMKKGHLLGWDQNRRWHELNFAANDYQRRESKPSRFVFKVLEEAGNVERKLGVE